MCSRKGLGGYPVKKSASIWTLSKGAKNALFFSKVPSRCPRERDGGGEQIFFFGIASLCLNMYFEFFLLLQKSHLWHLNIYSK